MSKIQYLDSPFIFAYTVDNHDDIKSEIIEKIDYFIDAGYADVDNTASGAITNYNYQTNPGGSIPLFKFNEQLNKSIVWDAIDELNTKLTQDRELLQLPVTCSLTNLWFNKYPVGAYCPPHEHYGVDISGIYIVHSDHENPTVFKNNVNVGNWRYARDKYTTGHIKEGTVLLFPSHLTHWTEPAQSDRYIISFDVSVNWATNPSILTDEKKSSLERDIDIANQFMKQYEGTVPIS